MDVQPSTIKSLNLTISEIIKEKHEREYVISTIKNILEQLNLIVIGGDYYSDNNLIIDFAVVDEIIDEVKKVIPLLPEAINDYNNLKEIIEFTNKFINERRNTFKTILNKNIKTDAGIFTFSLPEFIYNDDIVFSEDARSLNNFRKLLWFNMAIAEEDESLSCGKWQIEKLIRMEKELNKTIFTQSDILGNNVKRILVDKIKFLIKKIVLRERMCEEEELTFDDKKELGNINEKQTNAFEVFYKNSVELYLEKKTPYQKRPIVIKERYINGQRIYFSSDEEYELTSCEDVWKWSRHLRKRLKDDSLPHDEALSEIDIVLKVIKNNILIFEETTKEPTFESFALRSTYNLLFNTYIKVLLNKEIIENFKNCLSDTKNDSLKDISFVRDIFNKIKDKQDDMRIYDYHPYQTFLNFFRDFTSKIREDVFCLGIEKEKLDEKNEIENTKKIENKIVLIGKLYEDAIKLFQKNLKWCISKKWNPIYLEKKSSEKKSLDVEIKDITLFMDSSYVLPDNFAKIEEKWYAEDQYRMVTLRSTKNRAQFEIHRIVTESSVDRKKEEFEKKVKENEFKVVQIVAMFVTIATFVLTNVKIFENKSLSASMAVMFAFAACMLLFNAFFKWMIRDSLLINIDTLRSGKTGIGKGKSPLRFAKFFTDYKYSFSDVIMLGLIILCVFLAGYYRQKAAVDFQSTIQQIRPMIVDVYQDTLSYLSKKNRSEREKIIQGQIKDFYNLDSVNREKVIERAIQKSVKREALKP